MNDMQNAPILESRPSPLQVWQKALTKPNEQTYAELAASPNAKASTGYIWMFLAYLIQIFLAALVQSRLLSNYANQYGVGDVFADQGFGSTLFGAICSAPIGAAIGTLIFAVSVFIIQWLAKMFGGRGTSDQLTYAMASILAPYLIISGVVTLLAAIPYVGFCFSAILALAGLYILVLEVMAVKGVNQISWGAAIGSLLIPVFAIAFLCACLVAGLFSLLVPVLRDAAPNFAP